ncbi:uncharacterized protein LOC113215176 isoform X3 [Frankliniella occidentalis]|uniref:Uncharacterized protein LOC113215176 isoform X3 n=1 Tax=Frankliniella occidentalis TaxID=133901 RepID=A0A6J1TFP8_FRAOC|nr:uncharacterized protein LOC113215176 isoform X3 [Frankliniella occidentalis]
METLPDDVLLMVLDELEDDADVLACRLVCRRLAAVTLLPAVWRDRVICYSEPRCVCPVLRLAPCLYKLNVNLPAAGCRQSAYASTRCAASRLWINVDGTAHTSHAAAIICRQEALGRLRRVFIQIDTKTAPDVPMLLGTLASTPRLEKLRVVCVGEENDPLPTTPAAVLGSAVVTSSLRKFRCNLFPLTEPFVRFILSEHAATLEEVDLRNSSPSLTFTSTAPLLAAVTNLTKLTCCCLPGMEALTACKSLGVLDLTVHTDSLYRPAVAGVAKLLRRAEQLREVKLEYEPAVRSLADVGAELVSALASSGRSRVETLRISNYTLDLVENFPLLQPVVSALPSLSALRRLKLDENESKPDALLLAINPDVAPSLQRVEVWLDPMKVACNDDERCQACELDCHDEMKNERYWFIPCVFSHDPLAECPEDHLPDSCERWIYLPL